MRIRDQGAVTIGHTSIISVSSKLRHALTTKAVVLQCTIARSVPTDRRDQAFSQTLRIGGKIYCFLRQAGVPACCTLVL